MEITWEASLLPSKLFALLVPLCGQNLIERAAKSRRDSQPAGFEVGFFDFNHTVKNENPMSGGSLDDFLREEGILEEVEAAAHQRVAALQKASDDSLARCLLKFAGVADDLPSDLARNHNHYIHGHPKR